jgi:hypothetical protein
MHQRKPMLQNPALPPDQEGDRKSGNQNRDRHHLPDYQPSPGLHPPDTDTASRQSAGQIWPVCAATTEPASGPYQRGIGVLNGR